MRQHFKANSNIYLIINNGARVMQDKYRDFAIYISKNNINVVTYDYTDMGVSRDILKKSKTSITNWANYDLKKNIAFITTLDEKAKIFCLGHSLGGQIIGLSEDYFKMHGIILVAAQTGYWRFWNFPLSILNYLTWRVYVPSVLKLYNYFPRGIGKNIANMPRQATFEWMKWCRSKNYLFDHIPKSEQYYHKILCPLLSISFKNDIYATKKSVNWLTSKYINAKVSRKHYASDIIRYGHSAAFKPSNFKSIGNDIINFIINSK